MGQKEVQENRYVDYWEGTMVVPIANQKVVQMETPRVGLMEDQMGDHEVVNVHEMMDFVGIREAVGPEGDVEGHAPVDQMEEEVGVSMEMGKGDCHDDRCRGRVRNDDPYDLRKRDDNQFQSDNHRGDDRRMGSCRTDHPAYPSLENLCGHVEFRDCSDHVLCGFRFL